MKVYSLIGSLNAHTGKRDELIGILTSGHSMDSLSIIAPQDTE